MAIRPLIRERTWLFPPTLDELVWDDHPARFVGAFVDGLEGKIRAELEIAWDGELLGAPGYDPRGLLGVWIYGFMTGVRSCRKLEGACRDQLPYLWLTGWEHPDHNTLWRFYQAHREQMRKLLKRTVRVAVKVGLVEMAVQAVDGTKVKANAARERTYDRAGMEKLLARTEAAIRDLEAQNATGGDPPPARLPKKLTEGQALKEQVTAALAETEARTEEGSTEQSSAELNPDGPATGAPEARDEDGSGPSSARLPEELTGAQALKEQVTAVLVKTETRTEEGSTEQISAGLDPVEPATGDLEARTEDGGADRLPEELIEAQALEEQVTAALVETETRTDEGSTEQISAGLDPVEPATGDLEAGTEDGGGSSSARLPEELTGAQVLKEPVTAALVKTETRTEEGSTEQSSAGLTPVEPATGDLETGTEDGGGSLSARLAKELAEAQLLKEQVTAALAEMAAEGGPKHLNLTDGDAQWMKSRQGFVAGYNAQAMVSPLAPEAAGRTGLLIMATDVDNCPADQEQLVPMIEQAEANTGRPADITLADGGYHSGPNVDACAEAGHRVAMPESNRPAGKDPDPYGKDAFTYHEETDTYTCPEGKTLRFVGERHFKDRPASREYRASRAVCLSCPAFGKCTTARRQGRMLQVGPHEQALQAHRQWMASNEAKAAYKRRKQLPEPTFGILKEQQAARAFLLRGLHNVQAEWDLLATAFNLRTLYQVWRRWAVHRPTEQWMLTGAVTG